MVQGGEFRVNTTTTKEQTASSVAMDADGNFVVTWSSKDQDGDNWGVYAKRYNADGLAQGGEFRVNTSTAKEQMFSSVAMDADGNFVVTWSSKDQDGDSWGVYAQRYDAARRGPGSGVPGQPDHGQGANAFLGDHGCRRRFCHHLVEQRPGR